MEDNVINVVQLENLYLSISCSSLEIITGGKKFAFIRNNMKIRSKDKINRRDKFGLGIFKIFEMGKNGWWLNGDRCLETRVDIFRRVKLFELSFYSLVTRRKSRMVFLLVREITIERAFLLPVKGASVIESPERGREQIYRDPI